LALVVIVSQGLTRQARADALDHPVLRAIGMTPAQLAVSTLARGIAVSVIGAVLAVLGAVALSPLTPVGLARTAELHPGVAFDRPVLVLGALVLVASVLVLAVVASWRTSGLARIGLGRRLLVDDRPSRLGTAAARTQLPPTAVVGVRFALEPGEGPTAVPVRTTMLGVALVVGMLAATWTFAASLDRLLGTPQLYGWNWDVRSGAPGLPGVIADFLVPALTGDRAVHAVSAGTVTQVALDGRRVDVFALAQEQGDVVPTVTRGRAPRTRDELLLGARTLSAIHARVGDLVTARLGDRAHRMRIVGRGVFPDFGDAGQLGEGALMTFDGIQRLVPLAQKNVFLVRFRPSAHAASTAARIRGALDPIPTHTATRPSDLASIARVRSLPGVLAGLLIVLAAATLAHTLVTSVRRRRRDLAVLKTLGFERRQVSFAVVWQATTLTAVALLIGVPIGTAAGRWAWSLFVHQLGVTAGAVTPPLPILLTVPVTLLVANGIAAAPAWVAGRSPAALVLRTE
jgi:hypothetical protein